jgi:hypothetical protein
MFHLFALLSYLRLLGLLVADDLNFVVVIPIANISLFPTHCAFTFMCQYHTASDIFPLLIEAIHMSFYLISYRSIRKKVANNVIYLQNMPCGLIFLLIRRIGSMKHKNAPVSTRIEQRIMIMIHFTIR